MLETISLGHTPFDCKKNKKKNTCGEGGISPFYSIHHLVYVILSIARNPSHQDVFLWHIDRFVFSKNEKCDCAILTNKELVFIEFKTNAVLKSDESREENHRKACNQLLNTITEVQVRCQNVGVDLLQMVAVEAYAVFNNTIPRCSATQKRYSADFLFKSRGIKLKFKNSKKLK